MSFDRYTSIEAFRKRDHGNAHLRLLMRSSNRNYQLLADLTKGFWIGRDYPTGEQKLSEILTIDFRYSPTLDASEIVNRLIAIDLVEEDNSYRRYSVGSNSSRSFQFPIYSQTINAAFNDAYQIDGVFVPDPDDCPSFFISREIPAGTIDGSNRVFIAAYDIGAGTLEVYVNGLLLDESQYAVSVDDRTITLDDAVTVDGEIIVSYFIGVGDQVISGEVPSGLIDGSNATFQSAFDFVPETVAVYVNGLNQKRIQDFNTSGTRVISLSDSPGVGEEILLSYVRE